MHFKQYEWKVDKTVMLILCINLSDHRMPRRNINTKYVCKTDIQKELTLDSIHLVKME